MADDTPGTIVIVDGSNNNRNLLVGFDPSQNTASQFIPRTNGAPVNLANPLPVTDVVAETALGTPSDAAKPSTVAASAISLLKTLAQSIPPNATPALAASLVLKNAAGLLYSFTLSTTTASGWVLVFDAAAAPSAGAVLPKYAWPLQSFPAFLSVGFQVPAAFTTGIVICLSTASTPFTYTPSATAFISGQVL